MAMRGVNVQNSKRNIEGKLYLGLYGNEIAISIDFRKFISLSANNVLFTNKDSAKDPFLFHCIVPSIIALHFSPSLSSGQ